MIYIYNDIYVMIYIYIYISTCINHIPSSNQTWRAGKSSIHGGFHGNIMFDSQRVTGGWHLTPSPCLVRDHGYASSAKLSRLTVEWEYYTPDFLSYWCLAGNGGMG